MSSLFLMVKRVFTWLPVEMTARVEYLKPERAGVRTDCINIGIRMLLVNASNPIALYHTSYLVPYILRQTGVEGKADT